MSRSIQNDRPENPAVKFFEWNGEKGHFKYYDKKEKKNFDVALPFAFLVLDTLSTIKGWSDADQSGIWANEVKNLKTDVITVRTSKGVQVSGTYEQIKGKVSGADFVQSVYVMFKDGSDWKIGNIGMKGAALNAWIEFCKGRNIMQGAIRVESFTEGKKGKVTYRMPAFIQFQPKPETEQMAIEMDATLQVYLKDYFAYNKGAANTEAENEEIVKSEAAAAIDGIGHAPKQERAQAIMDDNAVVTAETSGLPADFDDDF